MTSRQQHPRQKATIEEVDDEQKAHQRAAAVIQLYKEFSYDTTPAEKAALRQVAYDSLGFLVAAGIEASEGKEGTPSE